MQQRLRQPFAVGAVEIVLAEGLAVVRGEGDRGVLQELALAEGFEQAADLAVHHADLAVVAGLVLGQAAVAEPLVARDCAAPGV